jgi:nucleoid-associated protein YgaU
MGRETKILLALLATLAGVFMGVLSIKLLVPRPPVGAGPDVHAEVAAARPIELVEPPALDPSTPLRSRFGAPTADEIAAVDRPGVRFSSPPSALPPLEPEGPSKTDTAGIAAARTAGPTSSPSDTAPVGIAPDGAPPPRRDPFVTSAAFEAAPPRGAMALPAAPQNVPQAEPRAGDTAGRFADDAPRYAPPVPADAPASTNAARGLPPAGAASTPTAGYECLPGDSWWSLAERAYGDGRLYRALFAWNRTIDPRVSLAPGTRLELPPRERLEAAWPKLVPGPAVN